VKVVSTSRDGIRSADFDPGPHRAALLSIIREIEALPQLDAAGLDRILRRYPRDGRGFFSRSEIIAGYRQLAAADADLAGERAFVARVRMRPVRTQSGVTPLTVLTKPFPCPGKCVFCPNDVRMPKSYLADEPGAQRAENNRFDPYLQTWNRLAAFRAIGHPTEKIELIVLGGTWSFYPERYQVWFAMRCFAAMNDFGAGIDRRAQVTRTAPDFRALSSEVAAQRIAGTYNRVVSRFLAQGHDGELLAASEGAAWAELEAAQRANESSGARCVGFAIETRPDHVDEAEVLRIRRLGCTKVQLGIQSTSDRVLRANRRGHDSAQTRTALRLLRGAGFKIHAHWMPNLLGSDPRHDVRDFARLFDDAAYCPDELKIYPCSLIESSELMDYYARGEWRPYDHSELLSVVGEALERTPRWCRLTRVIRDISSDDIVAGNKLTNFRQLAERALAERGGVCRDIRSREIRRESFAPEALQLRATAYRSSAGRELFLEYTTPEDRIVAFLRLLLPSAAAPIGELDGSALLREVHVYGASLDLGHRPGERTQHRGLGESLVEEAARRAGAAGYRDLAVISAVGTRHYYRKLGFEDGPLYQHRSLAPAVASPLALAAGYNAGIEGDRLLHEEMFPR